MTQDDLKGIAVGMPVVVDINNAGRVDGKVTQLPVVSKDDGNGNGGNPDGGTQKSGTSGGFSDRHPGIKLPKDVTRGTPLSI